MKESFEVPDKLPDSEAYEERIDPIVGRFIRSLKFLSEHPCFTFNELRDFLNVSSLVTQRVVCALEILGCIVAHESGSGYRSVIDFKNPF